MKSLVYLCYWVVGYAVYKHNSSTTTIQTKHYKHWEGIKQLDDNADMSTYRQIFMQTLFQKKTNKAIKQYKK